ncbi:hypothetical protein AB7008_45980 [Bradyrhizobium sp. 521_C7_N1_3]|uniref:hypothetical protein n=1 Tax=Bradyrhizobium TaxID=374 RepID=UPI002714AA6A|nr:hypothetical protein [Bradyrhizobium japonicum]WLB55048.1 hypothetical protein QIH94_03425 [Bradyrhizobium japonicum]WLB63078.1 hypothetical protein QIH96_42465 [Bradyrhizobium japonicum]
MTLLDHHGFTVSDALQKKMIGNIKIADLTLGELAKLSSPVEEVASTPEAAPKGGTPFRRRI